MVPRIQAAACNLQLAMLTGAVRLRTPRYLSCIWAGAAYIGGVAECAVSPPGFPESTAVKLGRRTGSTTSPQKVPICSMQWGFRQAASTK